MTDPTPPPVRRPRAARRRRGYSSGDRALDEKLRALVKELQTEDEDLVFEILATAARLARDQVSRLDRKLANSALKEMRYAFNIFSAYRGIRKVSIFGSARTCEGDPEYEVAKQFAGQIVQHGWMVVTGAGPGIMQAGHEGAGGEHSLGLNIRLPFEAKPNPVIADDPKLINFKYFFTRKLMFIKEADAFVLLPGGFGTLDETFELLTLIQTGKSDIHPIVMLDPPGGTFWADFERSMRDQLLTRGYVDESDFYLFHRCGSPQEAVRVIQQFYRVYHSQRIVDDRYILRLNAMPDPVALEGLSREFGDILFTPIEPTDASPQEIYDEDVPELPRIALAFDQTHFGRLRQLIDRLNELPVEGVAEASAS